MEFNRLISNVEPSKSVTLLAKTKELQKTDPEILNLTGGEPDFPTPKAVCDTVVAELAAGHTHYSDSRGDADLRARIARKLQEENHAPYQAENILITPGAKYAVYLTIRALINPGDEAIWLTPGWVSYPSIVEASGGKPVAVHLKYEENYRITEEALEAAASDKTKLLIINYPNNPTGQILTESDIQALTAFLRNHPDVYVLSDEIYEKIVYDQNKIVSLASIPEFFERVVIVNGFSKCSAMTGWRLGYACAPEVILKQMLKIHQYAIMCAPTTSQYAAVEALRNGDEDVQHMRESYDQRRRYLVNAFKEMGLECFEPYGAFYVFPSIKKFGMTSEEFATRLLSEQKLAVVPGTAFGASGEGFVRISYAYSIENLKVGLERIQKFIESLGGNDGRI